jgi:uncharacterized protein YaaW (UPF0174 family)
MSSLDKEFAKQHKAHGAILGTGTALVLSYTQKTTPVNAILIGVALGYGSSIYMKKYGHGMPTFE